MGELTIRSWELKDVAMCLFMMVIIDIFRCCTTQKNLIPHSLTIPHTHTHTQRIIYQTNIYI